MTATSAARGSRRFRVAVGALVGAILGLAIGLISQKPADALAGLCGPQPPPPPAGSCQSGWSCSSDMVWVEKWYPPGTACNDEDSCTINDVCQSGTVNNICAGTISCPPPVPGPISGPTSTITNGSYTVSWTASQSVNGVSSRYVDRYELFQNGGLVSSTGPLVTSVSFSGKGDGTYVLCDEGIPTSQQPTSQAKDAAGRTYQYEVPKPGGGTETKSVQQQTLDRSHPGRGHWEAGKVKSDPRTGEARFNRH